VRELTVATMRRLDRHEVYRFDTRGFLHQPEFLSPPVCANARAILEPAWRPSESTGLIDRVQGLVALNPVFAGIAQDIAARSGVYDTINQPMRVIESYALRRRDGSIQALHNGRSNSNESAFGISHRAMWREHTYHDGLLHCMMVKALIYLTDITDRADGPFVVVEGSHKANFAFPYTAEEMCAGAGLDDGGTSPVYAHAGDLLLVNEALTHGSLAKTSPGERIFIAFSFAPSFVGDYVELPTESIDLNALGFCE
jgi:Phytanoyl-CoA dioxygenase (PhyH)